MTHCQHSNSFYLRDDSQLQVCTAFHRQRPRAAGEFAQLTTDRDRAQQYTPTTQPNMRVDHKHSNSGDNPVLEGEAKVPGAQGGCGHGWRG